MLSMDKFYRLLSAPRSSGAREHERRGIRGGSSLRQLDGDPKRGRNSRDDGLASTALLLNDPPTTEREQHRPPAGNARAFGWAALDAVHSSQVWSFSPSWK